MWVSDISEHERMCHSLASQVDSKIGPHWRGLTSSYLKCLHCQSSWILQYVVINQNFDSYTKSHKNVRRDACKISMCFLSKLWRHLIYTSRPLGHAASQLSRQIEICSSLRNSHLQTSNTKVLVIIPSALPIIKSPSNAPRKVTLRRVKKKTCARQHYYSHPPPAKGMERRTRH